MIPDHMVVAEPEPEPPCMADRQVQARALARRDVVVGMTTGITASVDITQDDNVDSHDSLDDIQSLDSDDSIREAAGMRGRPSPIWITTHPLTHLTPRSHAPQRLSISPRPIAPPVTPPALRHRGVPSPRTPPGPPPPRIDAEIGYSSTSSSWRNASTDRYNMWTGPSRHFPSRTSRTIPVPVPLPTNHSPNGENESARSRSPSNVWN